MNSLAEMEGSILSYIESGLTLLENVFEMVDENVEISQLEVEFDRQCEELVVGVNEGIYQIRDQIKSGRPKNVESPNYEIEMIQYRKYLQTSLISMNQLTYWIHSFFEQIQIFIQNLFQWFNENSENLVQFVEQIADAFRLFFAFLNPH